MQVYYADFDKIKVFENKKNIKTLIIPKEENAYVVIDGKKSRTSVNGLDETRNVGAHENSAIHVHFDNETKEYVMPFIPEPKAIEWIDCVNVSVLILSSTGDISSNRKFQTTNVKSSTLQKKNIELDKNEWKKSLLSSQNVYIFLSDDKKLLTDFFHHYKQQIIEKNKIVFFTSLSNFLQILIQKKIHAK